MPVNSRRSDYLDARHDWDYVEHALGGERIIKNHTTTYLPKPTGLPNTSEGNAAYNAYLDRAEYPELVRLTLQGVIGLLHRKPARVELPTRLEYLLTQATPDSLSLDDLSKRISKQTASKGRAALLAEVREGRPTISYYPPECLINWSSTYRNGKEIIDFAVLETVEERPSKDDPFALEEYYAWRVLRLVDGVYQVDLWEEIGGSLSPSISNLFTTIGAQPSLIEEGIVPEIRGVPFDEVPLVIIGSMDISSDIDDVPMIGLARLARHIYRKSADYEQSLYMTSQPMMYGAGIAEQESERIEVVGSSTAYFFTDPTAKLEYVEVSGGGIEAQRLGILDLYSRAVQQGVSLLETQRRQVESGEALLLRQSAKTSSLLTIADTQGAGFQKILKFMARWEGLNEDDVVYEPNKDFIDITLTGNDIQALVNSWMQGAIPRSVLWHNLREGEIIPSDMTDEDLEQELSNG